MIRWSIEDRNYIRVENDHEVLMSIKYVHFEIR